MHLRLHENMYTGSWLDDEITPSLRKNINAIQESIRSIYEYRNQLSVNSKRD